MFVSFNEKALSQKGENIIAMGVRRRMPGFANVQRSKHSS